MKAQASIETLYLAIISFALVAIGIGALYYIGSSSTMLSGKAMFLKESAFFQSLTKEICITGNGNSREASFPFAFDVSYNNGIVNLNSSNGNMSYPLSCEVENTNVQGTVILENEQSKIKIIKK